MKTKPSRKGKQSIKAVEETEKMREIKERVREREREREREIEGEREGERVYVVSVFGW